MKDEYLEQQSKQVARFLGDWPTICRAGARGTASEKTMRAIGAVLSAVLKKTDVLVARTEWSTKEGTYNAARKVIKDHGVAGVKACGDVCYVARWGIDRKGISEKRLWGEVELTPRVQDMIEFAMLLSPKALARAWKIQSAEFSIDRPGRGDEAKQKRLNELWTKIK
jgi:hypothetical protein